MIASDLEIVLAKLPRQVQVVWLFGSQAQGFAEPESDIDLLLLSAEEIPEQTRLAFRQQVSACKHRIDLVFYSQAQFIQLVEQGDYMACQMMRGKMVYRQQADFCMPQIGIFNKEKAQKNSLFLLAEAVYYQELTQQIKDTLSLAHLYCQAIWHLYQAFLAYFETCPSVSKDLVKMHQNCQAHCPNLPNCETLQFLTAYQIKNQAQLPEVHAQQIQDWQRHTENMRQMVESLQRNYALHLV